MPPRPGRHEESIKEAADHVRFFDLERYPQHPGYDRGGGAAHGLLVPWWACDARCEPENHGPGFSAAPAPGRHGISKALIAPLPRACTVAIPHW